MYVLNTIVILTYFLSYSCTEEVFTASGLFYDVLQSSTFVDKTLLLKEFLKYRFALITAPRGFMKSTHLDMVKSFLSLSVYEDGRPEEMEYSAYYKIFKNLSIYKHDRKLFREYFGRHPIIHVDFKAESEVTRYSDVLGIMRRKIHGVYKQHRYLCNSFRLTETKKALCRAWCNETEYKKLDNTRAVNGLDELARFLFIHFRCEVFVLVDNYDDLITTSMNGLDDFLLRNVVQFVIGQISGVVKTNPHVLGSMVTGLSLITADGFANLNDINVNKFLHRHDYVQFFGFTENEVEFLYNKSNFGSKELQEAREWYNGYTCVAGRRMYSPVSILKYINTGIVADYWVQSGHFNIIKTVNSYPFIKDIIEDKLLMNKYHEIYFQRRFTVDYSFDLRNTFSDNNANLKDYVFFSYLAELGYLSIVYTPGKPSRKDRRNVSIPNRETWGYFFEQIKQYYVDVHHVSRKCFEHVGFGTYPLWLKEYTSRLGIGLGVPESIKQVQQLFENYTIPSISLSH